MVLINMSGKEGWPISKTIFVDGNRTDNYTEDGSIQRPFKTIQGAINLASSGYMIIINSGTYTEQITLKSGIVLRGKRNSVNINFNGGDVITRPDGVTSTWLHGLQVTVTGDGGYAAYKDLGTTGYIQIQHCYFGAYATNDFAIHGINSNNLWMNRTDSEGVVKLDSCVSCSMDESQITAQLQDGIPALHLLNCTSCIYQRSSITQSNVSAGSDAVKIDGGGGNQIALSNLTSTNQKAIHITGNSLNDVLALCGLSGGTSDCTLDLGSVLLWGINNYSPLNVTFNGTKIIISLAADFSLPMLNPANWVAPLPTDVENAIDRIAAVVAANHGAIP